jgi:molybdenum cofactor synthesis domain-containing protein
VAPGAEARQAAGVVLSDRASAGEYVDRSGPVLRRFLAAWGLDVRAVDVIPDAPARLVALLDSWAAEGVRLVLTSGGTGIGPRDRTPEALDGWAELRVPGVGEWMRAESAKHTSSGWLSRGGAWVKGRTVVIALPGSPKALEEILPGLAPIALHALEMAEGEGHGGVGSRKSGVGRGESEVGSRKSRVGRR